MKISERAMLVSLSISLWSGRKYDKDASHEVAANHNTDERRAGRFNKILVNPNNLRAIAGIAGSARNYQNQVTLPWLSDGSRIIPVDIYLEYTSKMSGYRSSFDAAVSDLVKDYDALVNQARLDLNGLFKESDYPSKESIVNKHAFNVRVFNLPDAADFRVGLSNSELEATRKDIETNLNEATDAAVKDVFERVKMRMDHFVRRMNEIEDGKGLRDSMMENIKELSNIMPRLNITGNREIDDIADKMKREIASYTTDDLRDSQGIRVATTKSAQEILDKVSAYI